jgi:hypothetical protein
METVNVPAKKHRSPSAHTIHFTAVLTPNCPLFTHEYTQCTAGYTFCFVVVVVVVGVGVGVGVGVVVVGATFSQTWQYFSQQLMKHDWT